MLNIFSHSTRKTTKEWWKYFLTRKLLHVNRGPDAVRESLLRGLNELNIPYRYNPPVIKETTLVLSGVGALKDALEAKKAGHVSKLIAGPNVTIHPDDQGGVLRDPNIDKVLVPSKWAADFWIHEAPELSSKIIIWPAGVAVAKASTRNGAPIIYDKLGDQAMLAAVKKVTPPETIVFTYGSFSKSRYLKALETAPFLIYLSESESQGLALQEAWAYDVPTLVNESNSWHRGEFSWQSEQINAPYLIPEAGMIFKSIEELPVLIKRTTTLHPKQYCDRELSDIVTTTKLLSSI